MSKSLNIVRCACVFNMHSQKSILHEWYSYLRNEVQVICKTSLNSYFDFINGCKNSQYLTHFYQAKAYSYNLLKVIIMANNKIGGMAMGIIINENNGWQFCKESDLPDYVKVDLPHTWNAHDIDITYERTRAWYKKSLYMDKAYKGKKIYLEFGAAGTMAELYINDIHVPYAKYDIYGIGNDIEYAHKGGFSKFRFDITDYVKCGEDNLVLVLVSNIAVTEIAPIRGDFNLQGGLYRDVQLVITNEVHVDMSDYGSCGLYLTPEKITDVTDNDNKDFRLSLQTKIVNESDCEKFVKVTAQLCEPSSFEVPDNDYIRKFLRFNPEDMYTEGGSIKAEFQREEVVLKSGESLEYNKVIDVIKPHLWDGLDSPYRYEVKLSVSADGEIVDEMVEYVGFKYCYMPSPSVDAGGNITGGKFYLNGREYVLRGAGKHQDWGRGKDGLGYAVTKKELLADAGIMYELGMNSVRLVHYQHANEEIELYDKLGILVWSEVGIVGNIVSATVDKYQAFVNISKVQLIEMIKQQYNHPSIYTWGLGNEISREVNSELEEITKWCEVPSGAEFQEALNDAAKTVDNIRPTTYAAFSMFERKTDWDSDTIAMNLYPYWYTELADNLHGGNKSMTGQIKYNFGVPDKNGRIKPMGISEYGASAIRGYTVPYEADGTVAYPGEKSYVTTYQAYLHEKVYNEIVNELPFLWCSGWSGRPSCR